MTTPPSLTTGDSEILAIDAVSKVFATNDGNLPAVGPVTFSAKPGEFIVFVGPSGCGKSTLLQMIAGFDRPSSGSISLSGRPVVKPDRDRLMMFQEHALFPWLNVIENVSFGLRWRERLTFRARKESAAAWLKMVHLEKFAKTRIHQLSGGMKQRVALARALAPNPKILLIDEPFPALDTMTRQRLYRDLQEIFVETGKTIISISHDTREAACLGDRVLVFSGRPGQIKTEIKVPLERPRDFNDPRVQEFATLIQAELESGAENESNQA